ncbi:protein of unknown function DUF58 [Isosphaera pallida ATCC 43644]|uniref:DUF58 domain-containing protein n=1 Tax=Isosphaera pallida (strain ATCC 43644 / DSM 9630 / IS1B) TaxID=575540 RepID=E8R0H8_ISOPI|nr:DUF58 domain-containing protein [Isosphaera pallida]ADV63310.1 protein of unknown function DUF58 [Isosphaera pallida ATCC 43644]
MSMSIPPSTAPTTPATPPTAPPTTPSEPIRPRNREESLLDPLFIQKIEQLELVSRKIFVGRMKGERRSKRKGTSVEFADHRTYSIGDDLRFIDWNVYARLDKLFLKLFMEEEDLHFYTLIDTSKSMGFGAPSKLRYAKQIAAALGYIGLINQDRVVLEHFNERLEPGLASVRGRSQLWRLIDHLEKLEPTGGSRLAAAAKTFAIKHAGKGVVVIVSDFLDKHGYEEALRYLLARNLDLYLIQVLSREETDPELAGDLKLVDCEDREITEITVSAPLLERYKATVNAYVSGLRDWCTQRGIVHLAITTDQPFDRLILDYLRRRGLVR